MQSSILSTRGKEKYSRDGYIYVKQINEHTHAASASKVERETVITKIKVRAAETVESTSQVINECFVNLPEACQGAMPNTRALKKIVRRKWKEIADFPGNPSNLEELVITDSFKTDHVTDSIDEQFLLADSCDASCRILIFGRKRNCNFLS